HSGYCGPLCACGRVTGAWQQHNAVDSARPAKSAFTEICSRPAAAFQRNEYVCASWRNCANGPFAVANFSSTSKAKCELLLSSGNRSRALADVARKFVLIVPLVEFVAEHHGGVGWTRGHL